jgi:chaperone required for assembly of F1-ATPase
MTAPLASTWKGVKRFYSRITVVPAPPATEGPSSSSSSSSAASSSLPHWQVLIEGRSLRTVGMHELRLPSRALAVAIAGEFAAQGEHVLPATTPLYNLASAAIDNYVLEDLAMAEDTEAEARAYRLSTFDRISEDAGRDGAAAQAAAAQAAAADGGNRAAAILAAHKVVDSTAPQHAQTSETGRSESGAMGSSGVSGTLRLRDLLLDHLETDTVCYRVDIDGEAGADPAERLLRKRQDKYYEPLANWFEESFGVRLGVAAGLQELVHPAAAYDAAEDSVDTASPWAKAVLAQAVGSTKSTVIALALLHRATDVEGAFAAARLEEEWQIGEHGFVEDGHDSQRAYLKLQLASAQAFLGMLPRELLPAQPPNPARKDHAAVLKTAVEARTARLAERRGREKSLLARKRAALRRMEQEEAAQRLAAAKQKQVGDGGSGAEGGKQ